MADFESYLQLCPTIYTYIPMGDLEPAFIQPFTGLQSRENDALWRNQRYRYHHQRPETADAKWKLDQFMILPGRVVGYQLKAKRFCELQLDGLEEPPEQKEDDSAFQELQMEPKNKELTKALIQYHMTRSQRGSQQPTTDFVPNKGDGLVILLHGEPGTGKTFTAASTGRALYRLGTADLGTRPADMKAALEFHLYLAAKWNAIMLFDEADVFLEQRRGNDTSLNRNAAVSILLRVLEYYDGILILTTNRIKAIDSAIVSRVTIAILYQKLEDLARKNVFRSFVDNIENSESRKRLVKWLEEEEWYDKFTRCPLNDLNGRQIRNVLMATFTLAKKHSDGAITVDDFHSILSVVTKFQNQAKNWQEENAKRAGLQDVVD